MKWRCGNGRDRECSMRTHEEIDQRSLAMHRLVASRILRDPELFQKARATLARWSGTVRVASQPRLAEWERLMNLGVDACLAVAVEDSQKAAALRQSSPFQVSSAIGSALPF